MENINQNLKSNFVKQTGNPGKFPRWVKIYTSILILIFAIFSYFAFKAFNEPGENWTPIIYPFVAINLTLKLWYVVLAPLAVGIYLSFLRKKKTFVALGLSTSLLISITLPISLLYITGLPNVIDPLTPEETIIALADELEAGNFKGASKLVGGTGYEIIDWFKEREDGREAANSFARELRTAKLKTKNDKVAVFTWYIETEYGRMIEQELRVVRLNKVTGWKVIFD
ncbi:MAG: hypothetical protein Q8Q06_04080 [bacterium]|nr:hypothetical protein [bacterium]